MESGLEDRNNVTTRDANPGGWPVSMESGLEDRNNSEGPKGLKILGAYQLSPA